MKVIRWASVATSSNQCSLAAYRKCTWNELWNSAMRRAFRQREIRSDLNSPESCAMSERLLKALGESGDFQSEYNSGRSVHSSNTQYQRMSVSVVACPRLEPSSRLLTPFERALSRLKV